MMWKRLYRTSSAKEKGTLFQLRQLIHRTSVHANPKDGMNATEDFLEVLLEGHILAASCSIAGVTSVTDFTKEVAAQHSITSLADEIVKSFVQPFFFSTGSSPEGDHVHKYSCDVLILALTWYSLRDAVREGDGTNVILLWKILLTAFR